MVPQLREKCGIILSTFLLFCTFFCSKMKQNVKKEVRDISIVKKAVVNVRHSLRAFIVGSIAVILILAILSAFYKPAYIVKYNGEFLGYCSSKSKMQERINKYITTGNSTNPNIAYVDMDSVPIYNFTFLKRNVETTDNEIFNTIASAGITYYHYYALQLDSQDKYYVSNYSEAEKVVDELKDKNSKNIDDIKIAERYDTKLETFTEIDECVSELYEKKKVYETPSGTVTSEYVEELGLDMIEPVNGMISSRFGIRARDNHKGLDIANSMGTTVRASASGTVTCARYSGGYGNLVIISHGNGIQTYYGHNSKFYVTEGQEVEQGDPIAAMGSTGISTGPHCHFEIRINGVPQNPQKYLFKDR